MRELAKSSGSSSCLRVIDSATAGWCSLLLAILPGSSQLLPRINRLNCLRFLHQRAFFSHIQFRVVFRGGCSVIPGTSTRGMARWCGGGACLDGYGQIKKERVGGSTEGREIEECSAWEGRLFVCRTHNLARTRAASWARCALSRHTAKTTRDGSCSETRPKVRAATRRRAKALLSRRAPG